jgi:serine/threonine-protein phosphatase 6 regulatory ankyrin repeat subunit A
MYSLNSVGQDTVETLLRHQADVNARDKNWQTPLHVAAANNAVRCAEYLIPLLTNVNVSDRAGRTSLQHASFNGHKEVIVCNICVQKLGILHQVV